MISSSSRPPGACTFCRKRKLRCDRQHPRCQSCIRLRQECVYVHRPIQPQQPRARKSYAKELEERLGNVENLIRSGHVGSDRNSHGGTSSISSRDYPALIDHTRASMTLTSETVLELEKVYFEAIYPSIPIIHHLRYAASKGLKDGTEPPLYLRYSMWAMAARASDTLSPSSSEYYKVARQLIEAAALADPKCRLSPIHRAQAWLHLAMWDNISGRYSLSWTSTGHAIRLLQIARVHNLDDSSGGHQDTSRSQNMDWSSLEEMRRTFWFAFCLDRISLIGQGLPTLLNEQDIRINLPASDEAYQSSTEEPAITLSQATSCGESSTLSPMSAIAVILSLCGSKLKYLQQLDADAVRQILGSGEWLKNTAGESLTTVYCVPAHLAITTDNIGANRLFLNFIVHCATICVHRMAQKIVQTSSSPHQMMFIEKSRHQCLIAASHILKLAQLATHSHFRHYHPATSFCIYHAMVSFAECFKVKQDFEYIASIRFLVDFMKSLRSRNQLATSLLGDFEVEYPSFMIELGSNNDEPSSAVRANESMSPAQSSLSTRPWLTEDASVGSSVQAFSECSPSVTKSPLFAWTEIQDWDNQAMDMNQVPYFLDPSDLEFNLNA